MSAINFAASNSIDEHHRHIWFAQRDDCLLFIQLQRQFKTNNSFINVNFISTCPMPHGPHEPYHMVIMIMMTSFTVWQYNGVKGEQNSASKDLKQERAGVLSQSIN